jgi:hypothetical protein
MTGSVVLVIVVVVGLDELDDGSGDMLAVCVDCGLGLVGEFEFNNDGLE